MYCIIVIVYYNNNTFSLLLPWEQLDMSRLKMCLWFRDNFVFKLLRELRKRCLIRCSKCSSSTCDIILLVNLPSSWHYFTGQFAGCISMYMYVCSTCTCTCHSLLLYCLLLYCFAYQLAG